MRNWAIHNVPNAARLAPSTAHVRVSDPRCALLAQWSAAATAHVESPRPARDRATNGPTSARNDRRPALAPHPPTVQLERGHRADSRRHHARSRRGQGVQGHECAEDRHARARGDDRHRSIAHELTDPSPVSGDANRGVVVAHELSVHAEPPRLLWPC